MGTDPDEIRLRVEIDRLLSKANVHRMRGEYIEAEDVYREALVLDESRADVREFVADMLYARGQLDSAAAEYKKIVELNPGRVSAETKYARVVLQIGEREHEKKITRGMIESPEKSAPPPRHPLLAFILSAVVPGLGQVYNRETIKGAIIFGAFLLSLLVLAMSPADTKNLLVVLGTMLYPAGGGGNPPVGGLVVLFVAILSFVYVYAVIDAPIAASKKIGPDISKSGAAGSGDEAPASSSIGALLKPPPNTFPPGQDAKPKPQPRDEGEE